MNREADIFLPAEKGYVVLDVESQGYVRFCPIEISAVRFAPDGQCLDAYSSLVRPRVARVSRYVSDLTGITTDMVRRAPLPREVIGSLRDFIGDSVIVGHAVAENDLPIIDHFCQELYHARLENLYVDTFYWAQALFPALGTGHYNLKALAEHFVIDAQTFHRAEADCRTTARLYQILHDATQRLPDAERIQVLHDFAHKNDPKKPPRKSTKGTAKKTSSRVVDYNSLPVFEAGDEKAAVIHLWHARKQICVEVRFAGSVPGAVDKFMDRHRECLWQAYLSNLRVADNISLPVLAQLWKILRAQGCRLYRRADVRFEGLEGREAKKEGAAKSRSCRRKRETEPSAAACAGSD